MDVSDVCLMGTRIGTSDALDESTVRIGTGMGQSGETGLRIGAFGLESILRDLLCGSANSLSVSCAEEDPILVLDVTDGISVPFQRLSDGSDGTDTRSETTERQRDVIH